MNPLIVPASLDSIPAVSAFARDAAAEAGLGSLAAYRLRLAVVELVTNSVTHGYCEAGLCGMVELRAEIDDRRLTVTIEDTAPPFDPTAAPPPDDLHLPAEERKVGGLGVYLALEGVDSFRYERVGDRNRSVLGVNRPPA